MSTIVVGVDGSENSAEALRFAIGEARTRGSEVRAVSAWHVPFLAYSGTGGLGGYTVPIEPAAYEKAARSTLERTLEGLNGDTEGVKVVPVVIGTPL